MARNICIIGAGIAGLHLALYLQKHGLDATLITDRTPEEYRDIRAREAYLDVNHWSDPKQHYYYHDHFFNFPAGQMQTPWGLLEQLRDECEALGGASSDAYFRVDGLLRELANPNLPDIPMRLPFRVEMGDRADQHVRWAIAATSCVAVAHAALDAALANSPAERFTLAEFGGLCWSEIARSNGLDNCR